MPGSSDIVSQTHESPPECYTLTEFYFMALLNSNLLLRGALSIIALFLAYYTYRTTTSRISHRRLAKQHGCGPIKRRDSIFGILGLDHIWKAYWSIKDHSAMEAAARSWNETQATTYVVSMLFQRFVVTIDPENVKTILSLNFKSWGLEELRKPLVPFLGEGIFSTDGEAWQHSRDMLRPNFAKTQIADLAMLEERVGDLITAIPQDDSTVDLQPLFIQFTLDVATQFLFGTSTRSLSPEGSTAENRTFAEAFDRCETVIGGAELTFAQFVANFLQILGLQNVYTKDCKIVHGKSNSSWSVHRISNITI